MGPAATNLDASTITATPGEGTVTLGWNIPEGANYHYIRVTYTHPETGKLHTRLASIHSSSIVIDDLMRRFGEIEFSLTPVTKQGAEGSTHKISATSLALPTTVSFREKTQIAFNTTNADDTRRNTSDVWLSTSHNSGSDGGGASALVDGNEASFWHGNWAQVRQNPNYIVVDLKEAVYAMDFKMLGRMGTNVPNKDAPRQFDVYGVNTFDGTAFLADPAGIETKNGAKLLLRVMDALPAETDREEGVVYRQTVNVAVAGHNNQVVGEAPFIFTKFGTEKYRYIIFKINTTYSGAHFPTLAELVVWKATYNIYNPETGETTEIK